MEDKLSTAVRLHQAGRLAEAERVYREVLSYNPNHPDALHFLGVLAGQAGHSKEAVRLISRAAEFRPKDADLLANLGRVQADQGDLEGSTGSYARATQLRPGEPRFWYALGVAHRIAGRGEPAVSALENAVRLNPSYAPAQTELGNLFRAGGQLDRALRHHSLAVSLAPESADAQNGLGNALLDAGRVEEAMAAFMSAVKHDPSKSVFHSNLGNALSRQERNQESLIAYDYAIGIDPGNIPALSGKAVILAKLNQFEQAIQLLKRALELKPDQVTTLLSLGETYLDAHEVEAAGKTFQRVLQLDPASLNGWIGLGAVQRASGEFGDAVASFHRALDINPNSAVALKNLSAIGSSANPELQRLKSLLEQKDLSDEDRVATGFAVGKLLDDAGNFDEAFERYAEANSLCRRMRAKEGDCFDGPGLRAMVDDQLKRFSSAYFASTRQWGNVGELPVFVVGMPRSGTTLVEQIAASHPRIFGAGELNDVGNIVKSLAAEGARTGGSWTREQISHAANTHYQHLSGLAGGALRVVDKMPGNIFYLALIADLFPNARVVFCNRDPRDTCLSCYFQWFARNSLIFSYDLNDCATQYLEQQRLLEHWMKNLPLRMLRVQYEDLVNDLEGQSRRLIDFLGMEWDSRCLEFHKTKRSVRTASVWQVRQPIYTSSVGRWRHYEKHIGPLLSVLGM